MTRIMKKHAFQPLVTFSAMALLLLMIGLVLLVRYGRLTQSSSNKLQVVAAENSWGSIAAQIGGDKVSVISIINNPNADPHLYESDAKDATEIARADVVITNGLGYDDFMNKLMNASSNGHRQDIEAAAIMNVNGPDANPHLWYDIQQIPAMSSAIESAFASKDPADQQYFAKNLQTFDDSLAPIEKEINLIKEDDPHAPVAYTERVPGYMLSDAGLDIRTPIGFATSIEDGNDPSPADTVAMDSLITGHHIQALLYNVQTVSAVTQHVQGLARQYGIPVVGVSETLPGNEPSYQSWMLDQVTALHEALHGK